MIEKEDIRVVIDNINSIIEVDTKRDMRIKMILKIKNILIQMIKNILKDPLLLIVQMNANVKLKKEMMVINGYQCQIK